MSNQISLIEGICNLEYILSYDLFYSSFISIRLQDLLVVSQIFVIYFIAFAVFGLSAPSSVTTSLKRMSKFFWMKEQNLFLILFSGLPGRYLLISDHLLPILLQSSRILWSYSSLQSSFLIRGSNLLINLYRICFPFLEPNISERSFQFLPYFLINFLMVQSSSDDHILWFLPSCDNLLYLWRHWFQFLSFMRVAISAHFFGNF